MRKLNEQTTAFCEEYVANGYKGPEAYAKVYENENDNVCRVEAWKKLRDPRVVDKIKEIEGSYKIVGFESGVDKRYVMDKIKTMMEATKQVYHQGELIKETPDYNAVNNAINTWAKLTGEFEAEKKHVITEDVSLITKDPSKMTDEELKEEKAKILKEL